MKPAGAQLWPYKDAGAPSPLKRTTCSTGTALSVLDESEHSNGASRNARSPGGSPCWSSDAWERRRTA